MGGEVNQGTECELLTTGKIEKRFGTGSEKLCTRALQKKTKKSNNTSGRGKNEESFSLWR